MLTKKELKKMVAENLNHIALYSKHDILQKHIAMYERDIQKMLPMMVEVYNYQHNHIIFADDVIVEVLQDDEEMADTLQAWYDTTNYFIALQILYSK